MAGVVTRAARMAFGGDYNPEQWPEQVWPEDVALMRAAGVTMVTVGVFSWAHLEPRPGEYEFGWLDRVLDLLGEAHIDVDLATATASPPPWLAQLHPDTLPVDQDGHPQWPGSRQAYCPSSTVFRERAAVLAERLAHRYAGHPALALWHVGNEYACHTTCCWCDTSAAAFRAWLADRYGDIDALNDAWGTSFWSQRYGEFAQVLPPRSTPTFGNPGQALDFRRFSSDEHLACFVAERDVLRRFTPDVPVTTNFMAHTEVVDYWRWAGEVDLVSNDHYLLAADPDNHRELAFCADVTRGLARGRPWLLMEHSTSAVNWQPRNVAKRPGETLRNSLQHVARGADGALFFQWRQSRAGAEKYHSALVPHAGTDSRLWREVVDLGAALARLAPVLGSTVQADVALVFDWQSWWATERDATPSVDVTYRDRALALHRALLAAGLTVDVLPPPTGDTELSGYRLVLAPTLHLVTDQTAKAFAAYVQAGGHLLVTYFSGTVDDNDHVHLGGYPGAFRDVLGVRVEEFCPLRRGERVRLVAAGGDAAADTGADAGVADVWAEDLHLTGADAVLTYFDGPVPGAPAVTRHRYGSGLAWYVATPTDDATTATIVRRACADAGVLAPYAVPADVEVVRRRGDDATFVFALNHGTEPAVLPIAGTDLVSGAVNEAELRLPGGAVAVVQRAKGH